MPDQIEKFPQSLQGVVYRLCDTSDPEERLEDAALWKALHDTFGKGITLLGKDDQVPEDVLFLGRERKTDLRDAAIDGRGYHPFQPSGLHYWNDPGFQASAGRDIWLEDLSGAEARVADLHADGKGAFLKSTWQKFQTLEIPVGTSFHEALGPMAFSYADMGQVLLVQEHVPMFFERRFLVVDRQIVTESPVAWHLTPLDGRRPEIEMGHFETPQSEDPIVHPKALQRMHAMAEKVIEASHLDHFCLDLCLLGQDLDRSPVAVIEFNPLQPGQVGLYACDPYRLAGAILDALPEDLRRIVEARQRGDIPAYMLPGNEDNEAPMDMDDAADIFLGKPLHAEDEEWSDGLDGP